MLEHEGLALRYEERLHTLALLVTDVLAVDGAQLWHAAEDLRAGGYTAAELRSVGVGAKELKRGGFTADELKAAGYAPWKLKAAGF